jgi:hypothetical protein
MEQPSRTPALRARRKCGVVCGAYPQGQFICPEDVRSQGPPENAQRFLGCEANACGFQKGDLGMILL